MCARQEESDAALKADHYALGQVRARRATALLAVIAVLAIPATAGADGDPASDVLLSTDVYLPYFPPPSKALAGLDPRWDGLVERCLETEPSARPHSALELAHALEALAGLSPAMALAPRTQRQNAKSGFWSWLGVGAGLAIILGMAALRVADDHRSPVPHTAARAVKKAPRR